MSAAISVRFAVSASDFAMPARSRAKARQMLAPNFVSPLVAETFFHLVRIIRRIDTVTSKDARRVPAVEAVLDLLTTWEFGDTGPPDVIVWVDSRSRPALICAAIGRSSSMSRSTAGR